MLNVEYGRVIIVSEQDAHVFVHISYLSLNKLVYRKPFQPEICGQKSSEAITEM